MALDVAVLPPREIAERAIAMSAALPAWESQGLTLNGEHLPHITLMQLFARTTELEEVLSRVGETLRDVAPMALSITGGGRGANTVWMVIDRTPQLLSLHERLMEALRGHESPGGGTDAFLPPPRADRATARPGRSGGAETAGCDEASLRDVLWVSGYRLESSFHRFTPHITLGHAVAAPAIEPRPFEADTVAVCHLGRFCTCRSVLRRWNLRAR